MKILWETSNPKIREIIHKNGGTIAGAISSRWNVHCYRIDTIDDLERVLLHLARRIDVKRWMISYSGLDQMLADDTPDRIGVSYWNVGTRTELVCSMCRSTKPDVKVIDGQLRCSKCDTQQIVDDLAWEDMVHNNRVDRIIEIVDIWNSLKAEYRLDQFDIAYARCVREGMPASFADYKILALKEID